MTELANHWAAKGWPITIIHYSAPGTPAAFPLDPRVTEVPLGLHRVSRNPISAVINNVRRIVVLRRAIRDSRPEVVLSFMANVVAILATRGLKVPVLVSEHRGPRGELSLPWSILREVTYRRADFVVMLTVERPCPPVAGASSSRTGRAQCAAGSVPGTGAGHAPHRRNRPGRRAAGHHGSRAARAGEGLRPADPRIRADRRRLADGPPGDLGRGRFARRSRADP